MNFVDASKSGLRNYIGFSGRASRSEYWYFALFNIIVTGIGSITDIIVFPDTDISPINTIITFLLLLPSIAISFRRLHDIDRTAWWILLTFTLKLLLCTNNFLFQVFFLCLTHYRAITLKFFHVFFQTFFHRN